MVGEGIADSLAANLIFRTWRANTWRFRVVTCLVWQRQYDLRVSFSALLRAKRGDRYVLIRNLHRQEAFCPIGGVYKYQDSAIPFLDSLEFRPQDRGPGDDMNNDLRGFLPRSRAGKMLRWFLAQKDRENYSECLSRELKEEIAEVRLSRRVRIPNLSFRRIRSCWEGPERVPGRSYSQMRLFEVFDPVAPAKPAKNLVSKLISLAETHNDLRLVSAKEIIEGRCRDGAVIGHHAAYLLGEKRVRPDLPIFSDEPSEEAAVSA